MTQLGRFYGVGIGPGDPKHLTLRAIEVLKAVDIIAYPVSPGRDGVDLEMLKEYLSPEVKTLELELPQDESDDVRHEVGEHGAGMIAEKLRQGFSVAFLTAGDPSLYSIYSYLLKYLKREIPEDLIETVPGITALSLAAARLNIPLALGDEPLVVLPSGEDADYYFDFPNVVMLKVSQRLPELLEILEYRGKSSVLASRIGQAGEEINWRPNSQDYADKNIDQMSVLVVKQGLENWLNKKEASNF